MSAMIALELVDYNVDPITFTPDGIDGAGVARWTTGDSVLDAQKEITLSVRRGKPASKVSRVNAKVVIPYIDDLDQRIGTDLVNIEFVLTKGGSLNQRRNLKAYLTGLLGSAVFIDAIENIRRPF
jgi:hypothetical protein